MRTIDERSSLMQSQQFRSIQTKKKIERAFLQLLQAQNFHEITVNAIIKSSSIGRSTFYFHYQDKYDLLKQIVTRYADRFELLVLKRIRCVEEALINPQENLHNELLSTSIHETIQELQKDKEVILLLLAIQTEEISLFNQYQEKILLLAPEFFKKMSRSYPDTFPLDYVSTILSQAFLSSLIWMLENDSDKNVFNFINDFQYTLLKLVTPLTSPKNDVL